MPDCVSKPVEGGSILFGGPIAASHPEHQHPETQLTVHVPASGANVPALRGRIVPGGLPHEGGWTDGIRSVVFHFDTVLLNEVSDGQAFSIAESEIKDSLILELGAVAAREFCSGWNDRLFLSSTHQVIAGMLIRRHGLRGRGEAGILKKLRDFADSRMHQQLSVPEMARAIGVGTQRLTRELKEATGLSPHQYVIRLRVERARQLLKDPKVALAEIAFGLGFSSQSHFTAVFRRHVGVTPKVYRTGL